MIVFVLFILFAVKLEGKAIR